MNDGTPPSTSRLAAGEIHAPDLDYAVKDGLLTIAINRPEKKNALTAEMFAGLTALFDAASQDESIAAVILSGAGDAFTAGADLSVFAGSPGVPAPEPMRFLDALGGCAAPLVAAVDGMAVGVGLTLLLHCDYVVAAPAARFRAPFINLGLTPEGASTVLAPARLGRAATTSLLMLGDELDAEQGARLGLVDELAPNPQTRALEIGRRLAEKPRAALRATKRLIVQGRAALVSDALEREAVAFEERMRSEEAQSAFAAFLNRPR